MKISLTSVVRAATIAALIAVAAPIALAQPAPAQNGRTAAREGQGGGRERHPDIRRGAHILTRARRVLARGAHDFGGHRTAAVRQIDQALGQLRLALRSDRDANQQNSASRMGNGMNGRRYAQNENGFVGNNRNGNGWQGRRTAQNGNGEQGREYAQNRNGVNGQNARERGGKEKHRVIRAGLKLCERAKNVLSHGAHDFDGHRTAAIQHVDQAISQLRQALQYDKS